MICFGGAFAYLERTQASSYVGSELLVIIDSSFGNTANNFQFKTPSNAAGGMLTIMAGVSWASPLYVRQFPRAVLRQYCVLRVLAVARVGSRCPDATGACPSPYCAMQGPVIGPTCQPVTPEVCYEAQAASDCLPGSQISDGSWT